MKTLKHYNVNENITYRTLVELQKFKAKRERETSYNALKLSR